LLVGGRRRSENFAPKCISPLPDTVRRWMGRLRVEIHDEIGNLRAEVRKEIAKVWNEMGKLRAEMQGMKADLIKWMFVFYVYQLLALSGIIFALVRFMR